MLCLALYHILFSGDDICKGGDAVPDGKADDPSPSLLCSPRWLPLADALSWWVGGLPTWHQVNLKYTNTLLWWVSLATGPTICLYQS